MPQAMRAPAPPNVAGRAGSIGSIAPSGLRWEDEIAAQLAAAGVRVSSASEPEEDEEDPGYAAGSTDHRSEHSKHCHSNNSNCRSSHKNSTVKLPSRGALSSSYFAAKNRPRASAGGAPGVPGLRDPPNRSKQSHGHALYAPGIPEESGGATGGDGEGEGPQVWRTNSFQRPIGAERAPGAGPGRLAQIFNPRLAKSFKLSLGHRHEGDAPE